MTPRSPYQRTGGDGKNRGGSHRRGRGGPSQESDGGRHKGGRRRSRSRHRRHNPAPKEAPFKHVFRRYSVEIFETFEEARAQIDELSEKAKEVDQLNIVIKAEGDMDDPDLNGVGNVKVFAGTAWAAIHQRRIEEGWYDEPR